MKTFGKQSVRQLMQAGACISAVGLALPAMAQETGAQTAATATDQAQNNSPGDIVVTAQKRKESLQNVPIAAVAVTGANLMQRNIRDMTDLATVAPSLKIDTPYGNSAPQITLRGVGSSTFNPNTETTVTLYLDEFVLNPVSSKLGQLFDVDRVEVLRGPQGTLYGKNSTGGAVNYITRRPDGTTAADFSATVGRFGEYDFSGGAQTAISDSLSVRVSLNRRYRDGYQYNSYLHERINDRNDWGGRIGFVYKSGNVDAYLKLFADRSHIAGYVNPTYGVNSDGSSTANGANPLTGALPTGNIDDIASDVHPHSNVDNRGATLNLNAGLGDMTLTSVSGFVHSTFHYYADQDGTPVNAVWVDFNSNTNQVSQELRLSSPTSGPLTWIAGGSFFYQDQKLNDSFVVPLFSLPPVTLLTHEQTTSFAAFADATYHLTDRLSFVAGARVTTDHKSFHHQTAFSLIGPFDINLSKRWTSPTYRAGINFQMDPRTLLYVSYNHGYRSGAFDVGFPTTTDQFKPANPEYVDSFEGGVKATLFDRRLRFSADVFYTKFRDQQLLIQRNDPNSICCSLVNAGKSEIYGFEVEGSARLTNFLNLNFQGTTLHSKYLQFESAGLDYTGQQLSNIPKYQIRLSPELHVPAGDGEFFLTPDVQFTGELRVSSTIDPYGRDIQQAYTVVNGQAGYRWSKSGRSVFAWVRNATNNRYKTDAGFFTSFGYNQLYLAAPVTYGITVTGSF